MGGETAAFAGSRLLTGLRFGVEVRRDARGRLLDCFFFSKDVIL